MTQRRVVVQVVAAIVLLLVAPGAVLAARGRALEASADLLLALDVRPFAIAHRGFGETLGTDHSRPIENTVAAVEEGFEAGASVVEVDVQLTRDGRLAAFQLLSPPRYQSTWRYPILIARNAAIASPAFSN